MGPTGRRTRTRQRRGTPSSDKRVYARSSRLKDERRCRSPPPAVAARSLTRSDPQRRLFPSEDGKDLPMKDIRDIYQEIAEQRAELMYCILSAEERRDRKSVV